MLKKIIFYLSLLVFLMALVPLLPKGIFSGHDIMTHLIYLTKFQDAFSQGQFPVRFNDWFVPGFNQPLSNFYQPGLYYMFLLPRLIGIPNTESLKILVLVLWALSGFLMYLFSKRHFGQMGGILGAAFYMFAPYHIGDLVVRAALSEFAALAFAPGIFWAAKAFYDTGKRYYLTLMAFFTASVVLSHGPTFIMYLPLFAGYIIYLFLQKKSVGFLASIIFSFILSFGLIAFFILPAFFEQQYIQIIFMRSGYYDFNNHFVCLAQLFLPSWGYGLSTNGCQDGMSFQIGLPHLLVVGMVVYFLIDRLLGGWRDWRASRRVTAGSLRPRTSDGTKERQDPQRLILLFLGFFAFYFYMMLPISLPFWENLPLVPFIQYSWRFLAVVMFVIAFLAAGLPQMFKKDTHKLAVFALLIILLPIFYIWYLHPSRYFSAKELNFDSPNFLQGVKPESGNFLPETGYMPNEAQVLPPIDELPENQAKILTGNPDINVIKIITHIKEYSVDTREKSKIRFYTHYFPGWKVYIDSEPAKFSYDNIYGFIDVNVPSGKHNVRLTFENTPVRTIGNFLSIVFALIAVALVFLPHDFYKRDSHRFKTDLRGSPRVLKSFPK